MRILACAYLLLLLHMHIYSGYLDISVRQGKGGRGHSHSRMHEFGGGWELLMSKTVFGYGCTRVYRLPFVKSSYQGGSDATIKNASSMSPSSAPSRCPGRKALFIDLIGVRL